MLASMAEYKDDQVMIDGKPLEEGLSTFFETRKSLLEPVGNAFGSGAQNGQSGSTTIKRSDFEKLGPSEQAKAAVAKTIVD